MWPILWRGGAWCRASDRGITLQTLIVTAVLVLMAVAAGVVIVAITNSSSDDLEEQSQDLEGRCTRTEIYDIELAVAGVKGQQGQEHLISAVQGDVVEGSDVGCIPVCFWEEVSEFDDSFNLIRGDGKIDADEIKFRRENNQPIIVADPSEVVLGFTDGAFENINAIFVDQTTIAGSYFGLATGPTAGRTRWSPEEFTITPSVFHSSLTGAAEVRVAPDGENCYIYNSSGQIVS